MLSKEEVKQIFEEVKANQKKLTGCVTPHDFQPAPTARRENTPFCDRYTCTKCKAWVTDDAYRWYVKGLEHARKEKPA